MLINHLKYKNVKIENAQTVYDILVDLRKELHEFELDKEYFYLIALSRSNKIRFIDLVSIGSATGTIVEPREVFRLAILKGVSGGLIMCHNHPSGNLEPSSEDKNITKRIKEAGNIIRIRLLDHIIFSDKEGFFSFANEGLL